VDDLQSHTKIARCTPRCKAICRPNVQDKGWQSSVNLSLLTPRFRQVTYDLAQVDPAQLFPLRDTIIAALEYFQDGPRAIILQLCLALSGLALQLPTWTNAVEGLIDSYGQNPSMVPVLLQFLTVLPEELISNTRIPVTVG
jgi:hypothetical protein